ncbi:MAG: hypothetical protein VX367_08155 [SAR324 cluster bacterium]|nr:hypothetical protein [SAR324 cluster bacterium]
MAVGSPGSNVKDIYIPLAMKTRLFIHQPKSFSRSMKAYFLTAGVIMAVGVIMTAGVFFDGRRLFDSGRENRIRFSELRPNAMESKECEGSKKEVRIERMQAGNAWDW